MSLAVDTALVVLGKGSVLLILAALASVLWRRSSAAGRHLLWTLALFGLILLPIAERLMPSIDLAWLPVRQAAAVTGPTAGWQPGGQTAAPAAPPVLTAPTPSELGGTPPPAASPFGASRLLPLWAIGTLLLLGRFTAGLAALRRLEAEAEPLDSSALLGVVEAPAHVRLLVHPQARMPCTWGLHRPVVLLPAEAASWSADGLRDVLVHELAHVERRDWLSSQLARLVCALFFFQPLVWLAAARMSREAELACDDRVLSGGASAPDYAERLLDFARTSWPGPPPLSASTAALQMARSNDLSLRIAAILDPKLRRKAMTRLNFAIVLTAALALVVSIAPSRLVHANGGAEIRENLAEVPLMAAAAAGDVEEIERLLAAGERVDVGVRGQGTPLIQAALAGERQAVRALLDAGADVELAELAGPRSIPRTPLGAAAASGDPVIVEWLLDAGADPEKAPRGDASPLMIAAAAGSLPVVERLLGAGADADRVLRGDGSVLIRAAGSGNAAVVARVLAAGADPNRVVPGDGSPLIRASLAGDVETVKLLLAAGADANQEVRGDGSPMIAATAGGHGEIVDLLVAAGARADRPVAGDGSPLIEAAGRGDVAMAEKLLDAGVDPDSAVRGDGSALIRAAASGHEKVVELLLDRGADIDQVVPGDENALIQAAGAGRLGTSQLLIARGADVNMRVEVEGWSGGREVRTPLSMARRGGHDEVVELLLRSGARD